MNRTHTTLAVSALALGAIGLTATEASAMTKDLGSGSVSQAAPNPTPDWPDEGTGYPGFQTKSPEYNYPNYDPAHEVPRVEAATVGSASDDNGVEILQDGASAVGGAGIALGAMWLYRRRQAPAT